MILASQAFALEKRFDLDYFPGIQPKDADRFIRLNPPVYYKAMQELLSDRAIDFIKSYDFDITSATDNRPYFHNFFKPALVKAITTYGPSQIPVTEWGWLILGILLAPVFLTALVCILLLLFSPGFFMGMPFPWGLGRIKQNQETALSWAWGINGFSSVVSILLAALLAILFGFKAVILLAAVFYLLAGMVSHYL